MWRRLICIPLGLLLLNAAACASASPSQGVSFVVHDLAEPQNRSITTLDCGAGVSVALVSDWVAPLKWRRTVYFNGVDTTPDLDTWVEYNLGEHWEVYPSRCLLIDGAYYMSFTRMPLWNKESRNPRKSFRPSEGLVNVPIIFVDGKFYTAGLYDMRRVTDKLDLTHPYAYPVREDGAQLLSPQAKIYEDNLPKIIFEPAGSEIINVE